jgi:hypothetical protein
VLAYLLLTGLHPIDATGIQEELLQRIVERPPLAFAARGIAAWPDVEAVLAKAMEKNPEQRFGDVGSLARAFASTRMRSRPRACSAVSAQQAFSKSVEIVRDLLPPATDFPVEYAWFGLRAALVLEDAELLAASDRIAEWAGPSWAARSVAAHVARARSDSRAESKAISGFLTAAELLPDGADVATAMLAAISMLDGTRFRGAEAIALAAWIVQRFDRLAVSAEPPQPAVNAEVLSYIELSLIRAGTARIRCDLPTRLHAMAKAHSSNVWLWSLAYDVLAEGEFRTLALAAPLPDNYLLRGLALLRLHQLTGDAKWTSRARRLLSRAPHDRLPELESALMVAELNAPQRATLPLFLMCPGGCTNKKGTDDGPLLYSDV